MPNIIERNAHELARTNPERARGYLARLALAHTITADTAGEIWIRVRDGVVTTAFERHTYEAHNADFEVCADPQCARAYALEHEMDDWESEVTQCKA